MAYVPGCLDFGFLKERQNDVRIRHNSDAPNISQNGHDDT